MLRRAFTAVVVGGTGGYTSCSGGFEYTCGVRGGRTLRHRVSHSFQLHWLGVASVYVVLVSRPSSSPSAVSFASTYTAVHWEGRSCSLKHGSVPRMLATLTFTWSQRAAVEHGSAARRHVCVVSHSWRLFLSESPCVVSSTQVALMQFTNHAHR